MNKETFLEDICWNTQSYLTLNEELISSGKINYLEYDSAVYHYLTEGAFEGRKYSIPENNHIVHIESIITSDERTLITGWSDNKSENIYVLAKNRKGDSVMIVPGSILRTWRADVSEHLGGSNQERFGFLLLLKENIQPNLPALLFLGETTQAINQSIIRKGSDHKIIMTILNCIDSSCSYDEACALFYNHDKFRLDFISVHKSTILNSRQTVLFESAAKKRNALLTVIIPFHGQPSILKIFLANEAKKLGAEKTRFIVVNNSQESTNELVSCCEYLELFFSYDITLINSSINLGYGGASNIAVSASGTRYCCISNIDVVIKKFDIESLIRLSHGKIIGPIQYNHHGALQHTELDVEIKKSTCRGLDYKKVITKLRNRNTIPAPSLIPDKNVDFFGAAMLFSETDTLRSLGPFSDSYIAAYHEDTDLAIRARKSGIGLMTSSALSVVHYESTASSWKIPKTPTIALNATSFTKVATAVKT